MGVAGVLDEPASTLRLNRIGDAARILLSPDAEHHAYAGKVGFQAGLNALFPDGIPVRNGEVIL